MTKIRTSTRALLVLFLLWGATVPTIAQNKQDLQMIAEVRILHEEVQQLHLELNKLLDLIKASNAQLTAKVDEQTATARNHYADLKAQVDTSSGLVSTLKQQVSDNTTKVGQLATEIQPIRKGIESLNEAFQIVIAQIQTPATTTDTPTTSTTGGGTAATPPSGTPTPRSLAPSPTGIIQLGMGFYGVKEYDLAIQTFEGYLQDFKTGEDGPKAQFFIGKSFQSMTPPDCTKAIQAFDKVIANEAWKASDFVPQAYYAEGSCYQVLKQPDKARKAYQKIITDYKDSPQAILAQQELPKIKGND